MSARLSLSKRRAIAAALVLVSCGGGIRIETQAAEACPVEAWQCPGALRWTVYGTAQNPWMDCWCRDQDLADWTFPIFAGDESRVRIEWVKYQARGCAP